jgi:hypothetical protein
VSPRVAGLSQQLSRATSVKQLYALEGAREGALVPGLPLNAKLRGLDSLRQRRPLSGTMSLGLGRQHSYAAYQGHQELPPAEELLAGMELEQAAQRRGSSPAAGGAQPGSISFSSPSRRSFMGLPSGSRRASRRTGVTLPPPSAEVSEQNDEAANAAAAAARRSGTKSSSDIKEELEVQLEERAAGLDDNWGLEVLVRVGGLAWRCQLAAAQACFELLSGCLVHDAVVVAQPRLCQRGSFDPAYPNVPADQHLHLPPSLPLAPFLQVGENWMPRLQDMGAASPGGQASDVDMATLKLFEFLTASMCLYVVDEQAASGREPHEVFQYSAPRGAKRWGARGAWRLMPTEPGRADCALCWDAAAVPGKLLGASAGSGH